MEPQFANGVPRNVSPYQRFLSGETLLLSVERYGDPVVCIARAKGEEGTAIEPLLFPEEQGQKEIRVKVPCTDPWMILGK